MTSRPDSPADLTRQREAMIRDQLEGRGIRDERVLSAMRRVPRERFVPETLRPDAYADQALPVECGQTISQPYMVARMSELCEIEPRQRVLEIGTGTGYQTAVLAALAGRVFTIEWRLPLMRAAADRLGELGIHNVTYRCGDGSLGWPEEAPFDAILVTAGGPHVPPALPQQLVVGGRLVIPVGPHNDQTLVRVRRTERGMEEEELFKCRFVKLLGEQGWVD